MVLTAELDPQGHHDTSDVSSAKDSVTARQRGQLSDRVPLLLGRPTHLAHPVLVDPLDHRQGQILLVLELVIKGAARVARLARHLFEHEVAVAVAGEAPRGRLQQRAPRASAPLSLGRTRASCVHRCRGAAHRDSIRTCTYIRSCGWRSTHEAPEQRAHLPALADSRAHPRLPARGRVGASGDGRRGRLPSTGAAVCLGRSVSKLLRRGPHALRDPVGGRGAARLGRPGRRPRLQGADAPRPVAGRSARRPVRPGLRRPPFLLAVPARRRVGRRDRQPDHARSPAHRLDPGPDGRLPRPDGCSREAKRTVRDRLHGRDQAVPAPGRVPGDDAPDRAAVAGARRRADTGARVARKEQRLGESPSLGSGGTVSAKNSTPYVETLRGLGLGLEDLSAWRNSGLPDEVFNEWLTDRVVRRPSGSRARQVYGAEDIHEFARRAILDELALGPSDNLLDVGCGGGLLLRDALATGASATGLDHSEEMVGLAGERAPGSRVVQASAENMPFEDATFTAVAMSIVLFFLGDPVGVLGECHRVLRPGGRLASYTTGPELRGTPAAPEPIASQGHFYPDRELVELARRAGLRAVQVRNDRGGQLLIARAKAAGRGG